ncbi:MULTISPECIES: ABC transporter permease [Sphingobium]|uniref:FtsX-like permease family protein n=1 Tax=Sphingobium limneticum TaxID=1007511 RepID=A0A5J5HWN1_9SPHN|nr:MULTISPECIES: FtsX-like permease family protein [Sphingobium]KAA9013969.1 FtsX-like permease family protein [Sphingobium limneticum]KAA9014424.1 FtsX-like permease family protein [Sphingobium limneticum]KAA9027125.1 FtsX-like permease family protein [Sphingobium limneticum]BBD03471.1 putative ABC transport system permease protein [Sphingobium sp. YG1]
MNALNWRASWRIARRDLHLGFRGLRLLFLCLFLGVATLAAIGSLTAAITQELSDRGRNLLGGDIEIAMTQREARLGDKEAFRQLGTLSETIRLRAMAQRVGQGAKDAPPAILTELKGVDAVYPLYGTLTLKSGTYSPLDPDHMLIGQALAERLEIRPGDRLRYGTADFTIGGIIADEPDRLGEGFTLGPVAIVSIDGLRRTGLIQPGSLYTAKYRIRLNPGFDPATVRKDMEKAHETDGWTLKDRDRAAPGANRFIERMGQFLSLIGLAALVIAGIGVSNGVASYLAGKRGGIATLKVLGATSTDIGRIYRMQVGVVALLGIAAGLVVGALLPPLIVALAGDVLPVSPGFRLHPLPLVTSAAYGLLIAFLFTFPPLGRARTQPAAAIFRGAVETRGGIDRRSLIAMGGAGGLLVALALLTAREPLFSAAVLGATAAVLLLLLGLGWAVRRLALIAPRPRRPLLRLALANLHRPGAQTAALIVALGLALTLFVTLAGIQTSLDREIRNVVPEKVPNQFVLDIPSVQVDRFRAIARKQAPEAQLNIVPSLRGTIVAYGAQRVADLKELPEGAWFLRGERGVTYSAALPQGSDLTAGQWWPRAYAGPPLVSLDEEAAKVMGIGIGDNLTVSILGREITARIASLRKVNWDTMGFNYILVFSPNTLAAAPHSMTATITMDARHDAAMTRALLAAFPGVSVIGVGDVIDQVGTIMTQMSRAIVAAASVAILAGIAVLVGAIAASRAARSYDSVILKTLGATRWQILGGQAIEYGLLASMLALVALGLGLTAAWFVIVRIFEFTWAPDWWVVLATLGGGALLTLGIGLAGAIPLMSIRPARALRQL